MIRTINFQFGRDSDSPNLCLDVSPLTVFVGPNNSGKSKVIREIFSFCGDGTKKQDFVVLESIAFIPRSQEEAVKLFESHKQELLPGETIASEFEKIGKGPIRHHLRRNDWIARVINPELAISYFCQYFVAMHTMMLDGVSRITLINDKPIGDLKHPAENTFQALFQDDAKRAVVRNLLKEAFGHYFVLDPTRVGQLAIRYSAVPPPNSIVERGIHSESVEFHAKAKPVASFSDGVKAFTGMIAEVIAGDPKILLIDEPEAFLHPSLAYLLGKEIAKATYGTADKRVFAATHSPEFIMGCIQTGLPANIVRLTYRQEKATARVLPKDRLEALMREPLLRSIGALSGLFYEAVIVTESDADRAFYQEINHRLLEFKPEWGIANCLFLNAQNKQTVHQIIEPLRELGIPAAAIVDIDIVKEGGSVWSNFLKSGHVPEVEIGPLSEIRRRIRDLLEATGKNMKRDGGVDLLNGSDREAANNLFDKLAEYGLFVVRKGELESWLKRLGVSGHGPAWLIEVFSKLGSDPSNSTYVRPTDDDVWNFVGVANRWFSNPDRKGIPV